MSNPMYVYSTSQPLTLPQSLCVLLITEHVNTARASFASSRINDREESHAIYIIHIHTYIHTHVYIHVCIHTYIYTYIYIHAHTRIYMHAHIYTCMHIYIHAYIYIYIHTHTYIYMHTYIHTYIHIYIHGIISLETWNGTNIAIFPLIFYGHYCYLPLLLPLQYLGEREY